MQTQLKLIIVAGFYIFIGLMSNVMSLKIVGYGSFTTDAGTLLYPAMFTLRDVFHKIGSKHEARVLILFTAGLTLLMSFLFQIVYILPSAQGSAPSSVFESLSPIWYIVIGSIVAMVISEMIDTEVYHQWVKRFKNKYQWGRVLSSNFVSTPIDSTVFAVIAFSATQSWAIVVAIIFSNIAIKYLVTVVSVPLIYLTGKTHEDKEDGGSLGDFR